LNRLEEDGSIVSTADEPASVPSTGTESSRVLASIRGLDIWVEGIASACSFAPIIAPPKSFEVPALLKKVDVLPMVPGTDVDG